MRQIEVTQSSQNGNYLAQKSSSHAALYLIGSLFIHIDWEECNRDYKRGRWSFAPWASYLPCVSG